MMICSPWKRSLLLMAAACTLPCAAAIAVARGDDVGAIARQLDVFAGIVRTTLATAPEVSGSVLAAAPNRISIEAYYLRGLGAVTIVSLPRSDAGFASLAYARADRELFGDASELARYELLAQERREAEMLAAQQARVEATAAMLAAEAAAAEGSTQAADAARALEELAAKLSEQTKDADEVKRELERRLESERERSAERRLEIQRKLEQVEKERSEVDAGAARLVESLAGEVADMLAGHGDSIGVVGADERVVVILRARSPARSLLPTAGPAQRSARIVSVVKSDVTALKSGKIDREEFDSRVLVYDN